MKEMDGDVGGDGGECKRKKREREREGNRRKHMPWRLVPRRSKAYLASSCSCHIARGTAAAQTALPRAPFFHRSSVASRRVAFLDLRGTRRGTGGAHCVLKTSRPLRRVRAPSEVSPPKTPLPIATYEVPVERWLDSSRGRGWDALRTWTLLSQRVQKRERAWRWRRLASLSISHSLSTAVSPCQWQLRTCRAIVFLRVQQTDSYHHNSAVMRSTVLKTDAKFSFKIKY